MEDSTVGANVLDLGSGARSPRRHHLALNRLISPDGDRLILNVQVPGTIFVDAADFFDQVDFTREVFSPTWRNRRHRLIIGALYFEPQFRKRFWNKVLWDINSENAFET